MLEYLTDVCAHVLSLKKQFKREKQHNTVRQSRLAIIKIIDMNVVNDETQRLFTYQIMDKGERVGCWLRH